MQVLASNPPTVNPRVANHPSRPRRPSCFISSPTTTATAPWAAASARRSAAQPAVPPRGRRADRAGLIPGAERVFECVHGERCTDISEDVARDAMGLALQQFKPIDGDLLNFLGRHLGCQSVADARREYAA